jgi:hypothetical protein
MVRLSAVLRCRNLFASMAGSRSTEWTCIVFGRCNTGQELLFGDKLLDVSNAEIAVTFMDREVVLASDEVRQWEISHPCGAVWLDVAIPNRRVHSFQVTINLSSDVLERVWNTDLRSEEIMIGIGFDELIPRRENGANAFLNEATVHFHTKVGSEGIFGSQLN